MKNLSKILKLIALSTCILLPVNSVLAANASGQVTASSESKPSTVDTQKLRFKIYNRLNDTYPNNNIEVTVFNNQVLLTGQVASKSIRQNVVKLAIELSDGNRVLNYLSVGKNQSAGRTSKDSVITTQVSTKLLTVSGVNTSNVKVVTTNGVVYLLGSADANQKVAIINNTKNVSGIKKVVDLLTDNS